VGNFNNSSQTDKGDLMSDLFCMSPTELSWNKSRELSILSFSFETRIRFML